MIAGLASRYADHGLLVVRLGFGLGFTWYHGLPKLRAGPEGWAGTGEAMARVGIGFAPVAWGFMAALAESLGGVLFAMGLFFRPVTLVLAFVMLVATVNHHVTGRGTPAHSFKNLWLFLGMAGVGPGRFSLDRVIADAKRRNGGQDQSSGVTGGVS
jgi:putative oxidoreductase